VDGSLFQKLDYFGKCACFALSVRRRSCDCASNAVNLTDGLDGLAIGCASSVTLAYMVMAYVAGHAMLAAYLQVPNVPEAGELGRLLRMPCWAPALVFSGSIAIRP